MPDLNRRDFLKLSAGAAGLSVLTGRRASGQAGAQRPNLLYVFPDQYRVFALGFMGADPVVTPNLDRFREESLFLPNAVSSAPVCSPHRGMLFTGRWSHETGVTSNCNSRSDSYLRADEVCFSDVLNANGWYCGYIGKLHLDRPTEADAKYGEGPRGGPNGTVWDTYTPPERRHGFRFWHAYGCCDRHLHPHYWVNDAPINQRLDVEGWSVEHETNVAIDYVRNADGKQRDPNQPWALFVSHNPPHPPYNQVPDRYREPHRTKRPESLLNRPNVTATGESERARNSVADYFAEVHGIDEQFGRLLAALEESGQADNTIVVFTSDHGEMMGSHGRMGKVVIYEESFRVPYLIRYPARLQQREHKLHLNTPDIMPTLLGMMGVGDQVPEQVQGHDHSQLLLTGRGEPPTSSFYRMGPAQPSTGQRGIRTDRYTFQVSFGGGAMVTLFDNQEDPYQLHNLAKENESLCRELLGELNRWLAEIGDPWGQLEWPLGAKNAFGIRTTEQGFRIDFEPGDGNGPQATPVSPLAMLTTAAGEVIGGQQSVKADTTGSAAKFHEFLRFTGLLQPGRKYEVVYRYRVLASDDQTQFYTVVRSTADTNQKAARLYWHEPPGEVKERRFTFETGDIADHHLLFGVQFKGAIVIDDIVVTEVK